MKVIKALYLDKAILLEGLPGTGKSSMIEYIAFKTNNRLEKITLSDQTDIVDLLGSDLPVPDAVTVGDKSNNDNENSNVNE
jgi:midasin